MPSAFDKGGGGQGLLQGVEEGVPGGVKRVFVLGAGVAEGGDEEGTPEHVLGCRFFRGVGCWGRCGCVYLMTFGPLSSLRVLKNNKRDRRLMYLGTFTPCIFPTFPQSFVGKEFLLGLFMLDALTGLPVAW